ncbi:hypothetical protein [Vibrio cholerae]|uniref:hypothetical protein n=1 Tax=Vibrio cholerae TaxID=666 RepID=UPI00084A47E0|nr:hypothetical protein [Vibrio cholerae]OEC29952.1 hypothetical protein BFX13_18275 [Vibrio cholerae]
MKTFKKEFGDVIVTAKVMPQLKRDLLAFKMLKVITPAMGVMQSEMDLGLVLGVVCHHASDTLFSELQTEMYGLLLTDKLESVENVEEWLELKGLNSLDILMWLFTETFTPLMQSVEVGKLKTMLSPMLNQIFEGKGE